MLWSKIQKQLDNQGRTVYWLSKQSGISDNALYSYKKNGVEPTFSKVCRIADALGVSLDELRDKNEERK